MVLDYLTSIFKSDQPNSIEASLNAISTRVTQEMNEGLMAEFKAKEVQKALKQCT